MQHVVENQPPNHKIWPWAKWGCGLLSLLGLLAILSLFLGLNFAQNPGLIQPEGCYFIDADCYSRMTRVRMIEAGEGPLLKTHLFENHPFGLSPHTTAPMDYAILGWHRLMGRDRDALDRSGYEISPLLGGLFLVFLWACSGFLHLPYRWGILLLAASSPALLHAFAAGRPDHQSLIVLLCGSALLIEALGWQEPQRRLWEWISGILWGLALWVSWFEPAILLAAIWALRWIVPAVLGTRRTAPFRSWCSYGTTVAIALAIMLLEGPPGTGLPPELRDAFFRWGASIGELQGSNPFSLLARWVGWAAWLVPPGLLIMLWKDRSAPSRFESMSAVWLVLWSILAVLCAWHIRWGYFLVLVSILALPWAFKWIRWKWAGYLLLFAGLWPMAAELERTLYPSGQALAQRNDRIQELRELRHAALFLRTQPGNGIVAPWWQTPALVYWSGKPGVGGSSHQSLPGNLAAAEVFLASTPEELTRAQTLLVERKVDFILVGDSRRILAQASQLLPRTQPAGASGRPLAEILEQAPRLAPPWLAPIYSEPGFKIHRVISPGISSENESY